MFENVGGYIILRHDIPVEVILQPLWDVYIKTKGQKNDFEEITLPDISNFRDELDAIRAHLKDLLTQNDENPALEIDEKITDDLNKIYQVIAKYLKEDVVKNRHLDDTINESALLIRKREGCQLMALIQSALVDPKYINECTSLVNKCGVVAQFFEILMHSSSEESFVKDISRNYSCKSFVKHAIVSERPNEIQVGSPVYSSSTIRMRDGIVSTPIDKADVWLNVPVLKKSFGVEPSKDEEYFEISDPDLPLGENIIAIQVGEYIFPLVSGFDGYIESKIDYYWANLKNGVYHKEDTSDDNSPISESQKKLIEDFRRAVKDDTLLYTLSHLTNNLYLPEDISVKDLYLLYFEQVAVARQLKHLENYEFLYQKGDESILLTTYQINKDNAMTAYNLLHMLVEHDEKTEDWYGPQMFKRLKRETVYVFKPEIAFYFMNRFYEDYFQSALEELCVDYVANQKVSYRGNLNEIDVIIKGKEKIYFVELKTTLSVHHILSYREKCKKWIEACPEIKEYMNFAIAGCYGNDELMICTKDPIECETREGVKTKIYDFSVEIEKGKDLHCFTEPNFVKLKEKMGRIFI